MKKILLIIPAIFCLWSCSVDMDTVFDQSSQERLQEAARKTREILIGAPNGWVLAYYPDASKWGGFNLVVQFFEEDKVIIYAGEEISSENPLPRSAESTWSVLMDRGLGLGFDTYNDIFHQIIYSGGLDMDGDFDFLLTSIDKERIEMTGRRKKCLLVMTPLDSETDPEDYYDIIQKMKADIAAHSFKIEVGGTEYEIPPYNEKNFFTILDPDGKTVASPVTFHHTRQGLRLYEPLQLGGKELSEFRYDADTDALISTTDQNLILQKIYMSIREYFLSSYGYYFNHNDGKMSDKFRSDIFHVYDYSNSGSTYAANWLLLGQGASNVDGMNMEIFWYANSYGYQTTTLYEFRNVPGYDERLELYYLQDYIGTNMGGRANVVKFNRAISNQTLQDPGTVYELSTDDPLNFTEIKFTSVSDPQIWFILSKAQIFLRDYFESL